MDKYPNLINGRFSATFTKKDGQNQWHEIASILNAIPGSKKDWIHWRKNSPDPMTSEWKKKDGQAFSTIGLNVDDDQLVHLRGTTTVKCAWNVLRSYHEKSTANSMKIIVTTYTSNYFEQICKLHTHIKNYLTDLEKKLPTMPQDDNGTDTNQEHRLRRQEIKMHQLGYRLQQIEESMGQEVDTVQLEMWQDQIQKQINAIEELDEDIQVYETKFEDNYFSGEFEKIKQWCDKIIVTIKNKVNMEKGKACSIKLPPIKLPIFNGGYEN
ncbi:hypothetical protein RI129_012794 [Pyrocoelia pectoralis]|uniref:Uncharacterized protein n=1 Tax=Pyrocoelia pectoralis TaxID=417401 RepID=A0AAN7V189_9COLE